MPQLLTPIRPKVSPPSVPSKKGPRPPKETRLDGLFRKAMMGFGILVIVLAAGICFELIRHSSDAWGKFGLSFLWGQSWDPVADQYGALPFIYGTLVSSFIALLIAIPLGVGSAVFLVEIVPRPIANFCGFLIELLAAIPSVILGLMGIFILVPFVAAIQPFFIEHLGFIPLFSGFPFGLGLFTAGLILAIMTLPYITSISKDVILSCPQPLREAGLALGATRWEVVKMVILPFSRSGIWGSIFLALGRALGETMAVTMVIGNRPEISASLFDPAYSMAAVIANEFAEATSDMNLSALIAIGLTLFGITVVVNGLARLMIHRLNPVRKTA